MMQFQSGGTMIPFNASAALQAFFNISPGQIYMSLTLIKIPIFFFPGKNISLLLLLPSCWVTESPDTSPQKQAPKTQTRSLICWGCEARSDRLCLACSSPTPLTWHLTQQDYIAPPKACTEQMRKSELLPCIRHMTSPASLSVAADIEGTAEILTTRKNPS